ncbi:MAG: heme-binding domain-containing protein [Ignavibacteriaceae bacterium]|nr:heme-binding domain-containing protein [Ignavibacteriaceae bacterium]
MKKFLIFLLIVLVGIQFIPVERTNPEVKNDLLTSAEVKNILVRSCYDCHSNQTEWTWYSKIAPASWLIVSDVNSGREHLNFSEWGNYKRNKQEELKREIWEEVLNENMPLWTYRIIHPSSKLNEAEKELIRAWSTGSR